RPPAYRRSSAARRCGTRMALRSTASAPLRFSCRLKTPTRHASFSARSRPGGFASTKPTMRQPRIKPARRATPRRDRSLSRIAGVVDVMRRASIIMTLPGDLRTERAILRRWTAADRAPFAALNRDPRVMEHFPAPLSADESNALADQIEAHFAKHEFGLWAVEIPGRTSFAGFVGLAVPGFDAHFTPCVEIGW